MAAPKGAMSKLLAGLSKPKPKPGAKPAFDPSDPYGDKAWAAAKQPKFYLHPGRYPQEKIPGWEKASPEVQEYTRRLLADRGVRTTDELVSGLISAAREHDTPRALRNKMFDAADLIQSTRNLWDVTPTEIPASALNRRPILSSVLPVAKPFAGGTTFSLTLGGGVTREPESGDMRFGVSSSYAAPLKPPKGQASWDAITNIFANTMSKPGGRSAQTFSPNMSPEEMAKRSGKFTWDDVPGPALDMSTEARMARAREQGFDVDTKLYHGTGADFPAFTPSKDGLMGPGVYLTRDPKLASTYATPDGRLRMNEARVDGAPSAGSGPNVMPVFARGNFDPRGSNRLAREAGADGIAQGDTRVVFDPKNVRSINAAFDPAKKDSTDLLASIGLGAATTGGLLAAGANNDTANAATPFRGSPAKIVDEVAPSATRNAWQAEEARVAAAAARRKESNFRAPAPVQAPRSKAHAMAQFMKPQQPDTWTDAVSGNTNRVNVPALLGGSAVAGAVGGGGLAVMSPAVQQSARENDFLSRAEAERQQLWKRLSDLNTEPPTNMTPRDMRQSLQMIWADRNENPGNQNEFDRQQLRKDFIAPENKYYKPPPGTPTMKPAAEQGPLTKLLMGSGPVKGSLGEKWGPALDNYTNLIRARHPGVDGELRQIIPGLVSAVIQDPITGLMEGPLEPLAYGMGAARDAWRTRVGRGKGELERLRAEEAAWKKRSVVR